MRTVRRLSAPVRFLARWDSALIAYDVRDRIYDVRDRILPEAYRAEVIKKNGDFLPTILVDGLVAGLWAVATTRGDAAHDHAVREGHGRRASRPGGGR